MFNPFKYKPVSQHDDEDEDVFYQGKSIPLSNLRRANFDDEVELVSRKQSITRHRSPFALCFVIAFCIIFVVLLISLISYITIPSSIPSEYFNNGQETNSAITSMTTIQTPVHHAVTPSSAVSSSSTIVESSPNSTSTAVEAFDNDMQSSTVSTISAVNIVTNAKISSSSSLSTVSIAILPAQAASTISSDVKPLLSPTAIKSITLTSTPTNDLSLGNNIVKMNSTVSTLNVTINTTVSFSGTVYTSGVSSYIQSTVSVPTSTDLPKAQNIIQWHKKSLSGSSECTPFVIDVNSDGIDDILYTHAHYTNHIDLYYCPSSTDYENACMKDTGYPVCGAVVVAVNGLNGEVIWLRNMTRPVFGIHCVMDVDDDGETDCFVIGRYHQWDTIDKATGDMIWEADKSIGYPGYNFYYPLPLEDFDGDGVVDILNIHGGDQSYRAEETDRSPALIIILSGKTGKKLIDPIVVPDGHESYMSPVRYTLGDKDVVLFGTGGETVTGSLWAITVGSIKEFVLSESLTFTHDISCSSEFMADKDKFRPKYDATIYRLENQNQQALADCPSLGQHLPITNKYKLCLYELYHSSSKGMIIPPVIIDMNSDNVQDLIIQSFGGHVLCLDGIDGRVLWNRHIPGSESYNIPAPLFYNDDDTPDLFLRVNIGEWRDYNYSYVVIIDGTDGKALWAMNSSYATMQSAVTLMSVNHSQDAIVFFAYNPIDTKDLNGTTVKRKQTNNDQVSTAFHNEEELKSNVSMAANNSQNTTELDEGDDNDNIFNDVKHQLWNLSNTSFPDPLVDPKSFIESCKFDPHQTEQQSYLYFITRDAVTGNDIQPIAAAFPGILIPGYGMIYSHSDNKRHGGVKPSLEYLQNNAWRCSHIQSPSIFSPVTPVIADLNHDGKSELIYALQFDNSLFTTSDIHSVFDLHTQTIENMVQSDMIDFSKFLPMEKQSWTTYMGSKGDGVYCFH